MQGGRKWLTQLLYTCTLWTLEVGWWWKKVALNAGEHSFVLASYPSIDKTGTEAETGWVSAFIKSSESRPTSRVGERERREWKRVIILLVACASWPAFLPAADWILSLSPALAHCLWFREGILAVLLLCRVVVLVGAKETTQTVSEWVRESSKSHSFCMEMCSWRMF